MPEPSTRPSFSWLHVLQAAIISVAVFTAIATCQADTSFFLNLAAAPVLLAIGIVSIVYAVRLRRHVGTVLAMLVVAAVIAAGIFVYNEKHPFQIRETARWLLGSRDYKKQVLALLDPPDGDFRHIEWDASGFAGIADNTAYLVFDPTDSLSEATGNDLPVGSHNFTCKVRTVRRLEKKWYSVLFYTDEIWNRCNLAKKL